MYSIYMEGRRGGGYFRVKMTKYAIYQGWKKNPGLKNQKITAQWVLLVFLGVLLEFNGFFFGFFNLKVVETH